jgi:hypothetical protein
VLPRFFNRALFCDKVCQPPRPQHFATQFKKQARGVGL